jgi:hypothetical protein
MSMGGRTSARCLKQYIKKFRRKYFLKFRNIILFIDYIKFDPQILIVIYILF